LRIAPSITGNPLNVDIVGPMLADVVTNHESWLRRRRERIELDGVTLLLGSAEAAIAFPPAGSDPAAAVARAVDAGVRELGCWAAAPDAELGRRLLQLGFQDGWQPHWMGREPGPDVDGPAAAESAECRAALPYGSDAHRAILGEPGVHHFAAREDGAVVGHAVLNVAGATAGVYDMGVADRYRRRGHGLALARAAIARAGELGCSSVTLNATGEGEPLYMRAGFASLGLGMTWWLFPQRSRP
jgi:GNAT superfamily N-acetyltransferase